MKELVGGAIGSCFPGTVIEMVVRLLDSLPGDRFEISAFREKLAQEAVSILIDPALPR